MAQTADLLIKGRPTRPHSQPKHVKEKKSLQSAVALFQMTFGNLFKNVSVATSCPSFPLRTFFFLTAINLMSSVLLCQEGVIASNIPFNQPSFFVIPIFLGAGHLDHGDSTLLYGEHLRGTDLFRLVQTVVISPIKLRAEQADGQSAQRYWKEGEAISIALSAPAPVLH